MKSVNRGMAGLLAGAGLALVVAGCGGGDSGAAALDSALEEQRAAVVSEFERAVREAQLLRDDIAAVRDEMRTMRKAADTEAERASEEAQRLRAEIVALRLEMQEMDEGASAQIEQTAADAKGLREDVQVLRNELRELRALRAAEAASLSPDEISGSLGYAPEYAQPLVVDDPAIRTRSSYSSRIYSPRAVIHTPYYVVRPPLRGSTRAVRNDDRRREDRRRDRPRRPKSDSSSSYVAETPDASGGAAGSSPVGIGDRSRPFAPNMPEAISETSRPSARPGFTSAPADVSRAYNRPPPAAVRPGTPTATPSRPIATPNRPIARPQPPAARPAASAPRPAPRAPSTPQKKVHTPQPER